MPAEQKFPHDVHASDVSQRFTRVTPSVTTDSEHEVLVELDSDSDVPNRKARKGRRTSSVPAINANKKASDRKKQALTNDFQTDPILSEDLLYHLMDQNKVLMDQNKSLTRRVELLEPAIDCPPPSPPDLPFDYPNAIPAYPEFPPHPNVFSAPPLGPPPPVKSKPKRVEDDKLYAQCREIWEVLPRLLKVLEAAAKQPGPGTAIEAKQDLVEDYGYYDPFSNMSMYPPDLYDELTRLDVSKSSFLVCLSDSERRLGVNQRFKKSGKKLKPKADSGRFKVFAGVGGADLMPAVWKAVGFLPVVLLVFVMMQLSIIGGDVLRVSRESSQSSAWLGLW